MERSLLFIGMAITFFGCGGTASLQVRNTDNGPVTITVIDSDRAIVTFKSVPVGALSDVQNIESGTYYVEKYVGCNANETGCDSVIPLHFNVSINKGSQILNSGEKKIE